MEKTTEPVKKLSWIKLIKNGLLAILIVFVLLCIYVFTYGSLKSILLESIASSTVGIVSSLESITSSTVGIVPSTVNLDFQNKSGVARIKSSFIDILISSEGSIKKGDGYVLLLQIINPSFITLRGITCEFRHSGSTTPVIYTDVNMSLFPGTSKKVQCFFFGFIRL